MADLSDLGKVLTVGAMLLDEDCSAEYLGCNVGVSVASLKRYLGELRHLGCEIVSRREPNGWFYRLENADAVRVRLLRWLELEQSRTLLG